MSERYTRLFSLKENLYSASSPVIISAGALVKDNQTGKILVQLKIRNIGEKKIKAATVNIMSYDTVNNPLDETVSKEYLDLSASRGEEFGQKVLVLLPNSSTRSFSVTFSRVIFEDNSIWNYTGEELSSLPKKETLTEKFSDLELVKEYKIQYGSDSVYFPQEVKGLWVCTCGEYNSSEENACHSCGKSKQSLFPFDLTELTAAKDARVEEERINTEKREEEERIAAEKAAKKRKKAFAIGSPIVCACIAFLIVLNTVIIPNNNYKVAVELMDSGKYEEAIVAFEAMDGYKDSAAQIENCNAAIKNIAYNDAVSLIDSGDIIGAYEALIALNGYKDCAAKASEIFDQYEKEKLKAATVGDTVLFGAYEQDNNNSNGKEYIEWRVLAKENNKILVISEYALDCQQYNTSDNDVTWETCSLRKWLNNTFLNAAFSVKERIRIECTTVSAGPRVKDGNATVDKIFLLSTTEAEEYFSSDEDRKCIPTAYADAQGAYTTFETKGGVYTCEWWLRLCGMFQFYAATVVHDGSVDDGGVCVTSKSRCVRPAMWIDLTHIGSM